MSCCVTVGAGFVSILNDDSTPSPKNGHVAANSIFNPKTEVRVPEIREKPEIRNSN